MNNIISNLQLIGFTLNEAKVYSSLLELGESKTGLLCNKTNIPNSHIYKILESLIEKGLISFKVFKNAKVYKANAPETLRSLFIKKKEELNKTEIQINKTISELKKTPKNQETQSDYKYFQGVKGIRSMWLEITSLMNNEDSMDAYTGSTESFEDLTQFYIDEVHKLRVKKKIDSKMILPIGALKEAKIREKIGKIECRYLSKTSHGEFIVHKDFVILQHTEKNQPRAFLIKDEIFAKTFKEIFNNLWQISKK